MNIPYMLGTMFTADRDRAKVLGVVLHVINGYVFSFVYLAVGPTLIFVMLSYALLWRNDTYRREEAAASVPGGQAPGMGNRTGRPPAGAPA